MPRSLVAVLVVAASAATVFATPPMGKRAREAGFPAAKDCSYCHGFEEHHAWAKARTMGISTNNCVACHGSTLPADKVFNDRGRWLRAEKDRRKAKEIDVAWLKDYVEPGKASPAPDHKPDAKSPR